MALIAAHLNAGVILVVIVYSPTSWYLGPRQYLFGDNSALNKFNQTKHTSVLRLKYQVCALSMLTDFWRTWPANADQRVATAT